MRYLGLMLLEHDYVVRFDVTLLPSWVSHVAYCNMDMTWKRKESSHEENSA
jgi:hypothetical protein